MLKYGKEYEAAGYPSITAQISTDQIKRSTFMWTAATAVTALMIAVSGLLGTLFFKIVIFIAAIWLVIVFSKLIKARTEDFNPFHYFMRINYFVLIMIISMSIDPLLR
ncbi:MAG: hypothetical protein P8100_14170 [bacterium]